MVKAIPDNYPRLSPYLAVRDAAAAIEFYSEALGFTQRGRVMTGPDGRIGHAELENGASLVMIADEWPEVGRVGPSKESSGITLSLYVSDVDATYAQAVKLGAASVTEPSDQFYGDRIAAIVDPFGHSWHLMSHIEDVDPEEMMRRMSSAP